MRKVKRSFYERAMKRPLDLGLSCLAILVLSPVFPVLAILVKWKLGSPILYRQKRPGYQEKIFTLYKFRTMTEERDINGTLKSDRERLTEFGRWLRETSLDELPELFNIWKGDLSFIGPRPLLVKYLPLYDREQKRRHEVRPGLTGLAQVHGRNSLSWEEKFQLDLQYVSHITLLADLKIMILTLGKVLRREGIHSETSETMEEFEGNLAERLLEQEVESGRRGIEPAAVALRDMEQNVVSKHKGKEPSAVTMEKEREQDAVSGEKEWEQEVNAEEVPKSLILIGAGGHGRSVADVAMKMNRWDTIAFLDDDPEGEFCMGFRVLGKVSDYVQYMDRAEFIVAIGNNRTRQKLQKTLRDAGARLPVLVHPAAVIGTQVTLGEGSVVMAGAIINCCSQIGSGCIINTGATVDHENCIGDYVHLSPGVHLAGRVKIGDGAWLGIGSTVSNDITIVGDTVIGAGALVLKGITESGTYVGVPARRI